MFLAHSAKPKENISAQSYAKHVNGVLDSAVNAAENAAHYTVGNNSLLVNVVRLAAKYHDLGKLDPENQRVLSGAIKAKHLPVQHTDAGTAYLWKEVSPLCAVLVRSHHIGLPDFVEEENKQEEDIFRDKSVKDRVDKTLHILLERHRDSLHEQKEANRAVGELTGDAAVFLRLALSCIADGDHGDTAINYGRQSNLDNIPELRATERLAALDRYVHELGSHDNERNRLRSTMYQACRNVEIDGNLVSCDSPVGTGKTTAIMAHLLSQAEKRKLRRIFIVLPFTNIISQSVKTYRKAMTLSGENPKEIVGELHHRADFQNVDIRHLTAFWKAPIIVTTAVAFFETIAANTPATLRRLHNLPGSAIFIDESHAALPAKLLPIAWHWMKTLSNEWGCYWVLASGSLNRFWEIPEFDENPPNVPEILASDTREKLSIFESQRISYRYRAQPLNTETLVKWLRLLPGPRILIVNTVQSAAVIARECLKEFGRHRVEHLSTALTPNDRASTLDRVKARLSNNSETNWTLVATSCVEAGMDFSFRTGVREIGSLVSLLQIAGRVKRHGGHELSEVWSIRLAEEGLLKMHPGLKNSATILREYLENEVVISPALCTEALMREIRLAGNFKDKLSKRETEMRFPQVEKDFRVIDADTRLTVIDKALIERLEQHRLVDWRKLQQGSVQIWGYRLEALRIPEIRVGIYKWEYSYDTFIGYMAGVLPVLECEQCGGAII